MKHLEPTLCVHLEPRTLANEGQSRMSKQAMNRCAAGRSRANGGLDLTEGDIDSFVAGSDQETPTRQARRAWQTVKEKAIQDLES